MDFAKHALLNDSTAAAAFRKNYPNSPGNQPPTIVACDGATSDAFHSGLVPGPEFETYVSAATNGDGNYCAAASEDSATLEALVRGAKAGLVDFGRVIVMRTGANFDRPPPHLTPKQFIKINPGGLQPSTANLVAVGLPIIRGILREWEHGFKAGVQPPNYIGDIFGTLQGIPDFGLM